MRRLGTMTAILVLVICTLAPPGARAQGVVNLVSRATPSVAYVVSFGTDGKPHESGTAFAIGNGLLLTALHVVATATKVTVQFPTQTAVAADVVGIDTDQDVAVLHLAETPPSVPAALPLASSAAVQLGESVTVLGYPLASPEHPTLTVTQGIVSALNVESKFLQIDAPINPGNSGGPVLAADGRVIGTYVHGLFADDRQRAVWLQRCGAGTSNVAYENLIEHTLDSLAAHLAAHIDIDRLLKLAR